MKVPRSRSFHRSRVGEAMSVSVQSEDFDVGAETVALSTGRNEVGAVATFVGLVRADKCSQVGAGNTAIGGRRV